MLRKLWERWKVVARKIGMCNRDFCSVSSISSFSPRSVWRCGCGPIHFDSNDRIFPIGSPEGAIRQARSR